MKSSQSRMNAEELVLFTFNWVTELQSTQVRHYGQLGMAAWFVADTGELKTCEVQSKSVSVKFWLQVDLRAKQREIWRDWRFKWCNCKLINFMGQATMAKAQFMAERAWKNCWVSVVTLTDQWCAHYYSGGHSCFFVWQKGAGNDSTERSVRGFTDPARQWRWMTFSKPTWNANGHKRLESCKGGWYYDVYFNILCGYLEYFMITPFTLDATLQWCLIVFGYLSTNVAFQPKNCAPGRLQSPHLYGSKHLVLVWTFAAI